MTSTRSRPDSSSSDPGRHCGPAGPARGPDRPRSRSPDWDFDEPSDLAAILATLPPVGAVGDIRRVDRLPDQRPRGLARPDRRLQPRQAGRGRHRCPLADGSHTRVSRARRRVPPPRLHSGPRTDARWFRLQKELAAHDSRQRPRLGARRRHRLRDPRAPRYSSGMGSPCNRRTLRRLGSATCRSSRSSPPNGRSTGTSSGGSRFALRPRSTTRIASGSARLIRADIFGWVYPGRPRAAAILAHRDASLSHVANGIYGEMWAAALVSSAFVATDALDAVERSLDHVPPTSRLAGAVRDVLAMHAAGDAWACRAGRHPGPLRALQLVPHDQQRGDHRCRSPLGRLVTSPRRSA